MNEPPPPSIARKLLAPTLLLALLTVPFLFWDDLAYSLGLDVLMRSLLALRHLLGIAIWLLLALVVVRIFNVAVWEGLVEKRLGWPVPKLLRDVFAVLVMLCAVAGIISVVFGKSLTMFVAITGGTGFIVGLAMQRMIADLFAGIVLNIEQPFKIGEEVILGDTLLWGVVEDITWRSTTFIESKSQQRVRLPNSQVMNEKILSWTMDGDAFFSPMYFQFDWEVPVDRALRVLAAAAAEAQEDLGERTTKLNIAKVDGMGYQVRVRYWLRDATLADDRRRLVQALQRHMTIAGIRPVPVDGLRIQYAAIKRELPSPQQQKLDLLGSVDLLRALEAGEIQWLTERMRPRQYAEGEAIIERGAEGESMFFLFEGVVDVYVWAEDREEEIKVNRLGPGHYFGELSLLTGEARTATVRATTSAVLYEITKGDFRQLLEKRPEIAEQLARVIVEHRVRSEEKLRDLGSEELAEETASLTSRVLTKLKGFFGI